MDNIFKYENWPYFFIAIIIFLVLINARKCHDSGKYLTQIGEENAMIRKVVVPVHGINTTAANAGANAGAQVAAQTAAQVAQQIAQQVSEKSAAVSEQRATQVAAKVAAQTTANVLTETFAKRPVVKPVKVVKASPKIPKTFVTSEPFRSVRRVAQRENFAKIDPAYETKEGVNMGAAGCGCSGDSCACAPDSSNLRVAPCATCNENLNDQINLGVNNYLFPYCNNGYACANGCDIQDQINSYQYDYFTGHSCTELERSRAGAYTSLNVDSCSQDCPSMNWMPEATATREAAAEYIASLQPVTLPATVTQPVNTRIESFKKK